MEVYIGIVGISLFVLLMLIGMPIGPVMLTVGFLGFGLIMGWQPSLSMLAAEFYSKASDYVLGVIPLFTLMGYLGTYFRLSDELFSAAQKMVGHWRGGIAMATAIACALFGAICGTSIGVAAAVGAMAYPEMKRLKYKKEMATALIASAGNIGFLIPPSLILVIYGILTEQSIGVLFIAGIVPGILLTLLFMVTIWFWCRLRPNVCEVTDPVPFSERINSIRLVLPSILVIGFVLAGIYFGIVTATEAAAYGVVGIILVSVLRRRFSLNGLIEALRETVKLSGKLYLLIIGAMVFVRFVTVSDIPQYLVSSFINSGLPREIILIMTLVAYVLLGFFLDVIPIVLITAPLLHFALVQMGYDPVWLTVLICMTILIGQITPPFGINVYAVASMISDVSVSDVFRGTWPFIIATIVCLAVLFFVPSLVTFLPRLMFQMR
ncbi:MAG: TRAP transporter large permease [candidate division WOR-3 bacterium]